ncbi:MAG TPA: 16S rRNA (cytosine(967)-C(5))-methyltransferase RsmB [Mobilitalea sp.]|nr:16S rRNA (cytosine(967)-C(5))-methyltransferase RsmB [Mobilitalea sp.]
MIDKVNAREIVLDMLLEVIEGEKYSHTVLNQTLRRYQELEKQERAFISRLFTGTVKIYLTLDHVINQFASIPVRKMKPIIRNILRLSVYQLMFMDQVPESAVCNEAVKLTKKRGFAKLSGFINANLRNIIRGSATITYPDKEIKPREYLEIMYSVPIWLVNKLLEQYSFDVVEAMLAASLKEKEITIRCNQSKLTPVQLKEVLITEGVTVEDSEYLEYAFKISDYDYLEKLKSFNQGYFAIQDISSMLVCQVAQISENDFVVDVCAAPGGKTLHAAEKAKRVSARDLTEYKLHLVEENINRLGIRNIETKVWDATELDSEIVGQADVVLCDLPCSGLGVLRKKSDIKYKLTQNQQKELVELQRTILGIAQNYVKPGGILIYSTCTVNKDENLDNRDWFLKHYEFDPENLDVFLPDSLQNTDTKAGYLQLIQGVQNTDGFFLARMRRRQE